MKKCYNSFIFQSNDLKSTGSVYSDINNTTVSNFCLLLIIYMVFGQKIVPSFRLKFDDVNVALSLIVLS